jgi:hypothetical protein
MSRIEGSAGELAGVGVQAGTPLHVIGKPNPYGTLGHYRMAATSGTINANIGASTHLFTVRWTHASYLMVVHYLAVRFQTLTLFTAATLTDFGFDLKKATNVSAGGGGTAVTGFTKMRTSKMAASQLVATGTDVRIANTNILTAITTLDTNAIASSIGDTQRVNVAAGTEEQRVNDPTLIFAPDVGSGEHPLVLEANEGLAVINRAGWPAAGTGIIQVEMSWSEVTAY